MAKSYKKFSKGEIINEFPGVTWNQMVDAAEWVDGNQNKVANPRGSASGRQNLVLRFINATDAVLDSQFPIVSFNAPGKLISDDGGVTSEAMLMNGISPDEDAAGFAVLQGQAGKLDITTGVVRGYTWAQVDIKNKGDKNCGVITDDIDSLNSDKTGARIVWAERQDDIGNETGIQLCIVEVGGRGPEAAGAGDKAMILQNIPAASAIDGTQTTATPGKTDMNSVGGDGAHIMRWKRDANGDTISPPVDLEEDKNDVGEVNKMDAINMSSTDIRASTTEPVLVTGYVEDVGGESLFIVTNVMDFRAVPGFAEGSVGAIADTQIPHHIGGSKDFTLSGEEC